jgi:hypothetical protein
VRQRKEDGSRLPAAAVSRWRGESAILGRGKRKSCENTRAPRFFSCRGVPAPSSFRKIKLRLNAPTCTNCRFRMFSRPCIFLMKPIAIPG